MGTSTKQRGIILLEQESNDTHWGIADSIIADHRTMDDCKTIRQRQAARSIVSYAHPLLHRIPWAVPDSVANKNAQLAIKKQPFRWFQGSRSALSPNLLKLQTAAQSSGWQAAAINQTPALIWAHDNELTEYQVWVGYRVAVGQLNLYFTG